MDVSEVKSGTVATTKVGRNEVEVTVIETVADGWMVKSNSSGREFLAKKLERIINQPGASEAVSSENADPELAGSESTAPAETTARAFDEGGTEGGVEGETGGEAEGETEDGDETLNPAPETCTAVKPKKKTSLLDAAAMVLKQALSPLNCKEIIAKAVADGLWTPTGAKTPEQSLYSAMFREIRDKENPRFKKSETRKGSFEYNG